MCEKLCNYKSLPELRKHGLLNRDTLFIVNEINDEKIKNFDGNSLDVLEDPDKYELHRSHSLGYNSRKIKTPVKNYSDCEVPNIELKEVQVDNQQKLEEDLDSGLCSANEDTENHKKVPVSLVDENNLQSELKLKAKEVREKIRRRNLSRFKHSRNNVIHGSFMVERGGYFGKRRNKISYNSELNNLRSFKNKLNGRRLKKIDFDFCSEIKEEETITIVDEATKVENNHLCVDNSTKSLMNSLESIYYKNPNLHKNAVAAVNIAAAAAASASVPNDETLQKLIDIVIPPLINSSNFDLARTDNVALSLIMHQHLNEASTAVKLDFNSLNSKQPEQIEANEQIMRTCLGYLDHINKKHTRELQIQAIKNKISGIVLLTVVFLMVFGLGVIMSIYLVKSLTDIMKQSGNTISSKINNTNTNNKIIKNETTYFLFETKIQNVSKFIRDYT